MEIASKGQLRWAYARVALIAVPLILMLGGMSGTLSGSGGGNAWYAALNKPFFTPPPWVFSLVWTVLYIMMGFAMSIIWHAKGNPLRTTALALFGAQLVLNLLWSPVFFGAHALLWAAAINGTLCALIIATTMIFWRIRPSAGSLMLPYLAWSVFAFALNVALFAMNPGDSPAFNTEPGFTADSNGVDLSVQAPVTLDAPLPSPDALNGVEQDLSAPAMDMAPLSTGTAPAPNAPMDLLPAPTAPLTAPSGPVAPAPVGDAPAASPTLPAPPPGE